MYNNQQDKIGITQFEDCFYDLLSRIVTNSEHIEQNREFYSQVVWKTFEKYNTSRTEVYSITQIVAIFEIVLDAMFSYKPSVDLPEDLITIS